MQLKSGIIFSAPRVEIHQLFAYSHPIIPPHPSHASDFQGVDKQIFAKKEVKPMRSKLLALIRSALDEAIYLF